MPYETGPVDPSLPMELDDGRPVTPIEIFDNRLYVSVTGHWRREGRENLRSTDAWSYDQPTGVFIGGSAETHFVLRNVDLGPDKTAEWFV